MKDIQMALFKISSSFSGIWDENLGGKVMTGPSPPNFLEAIPRAYPRALATGTATAFPT